jgi:superfamily II DNA or RNA helicase
MSVPVNKKAYKWQDTALARFVRAAYFAIVADCGVGKTLAAIRIAVAKNMPVIVITSTHRLCEQWKNDILQDTGPDEDVWVYDKPTETKQGNSYRAAFEAWLKTRANEKEENLD